MKKILVIDDEQDLCYLVKRTLERAGDYEVVTTSIPEDVLHLCSQEKPDLVLLDIVMPNVDGRDILKEIRESPETGDPLVIVTSGLGEMVYDKDQDKWNWMPNQPVVHERGDVIKERSAERAAKAYGADDFLAKPFSPGTLLRVVKEVFLRPSKP